MSPHVELTTCLQITAGNVFLAEIDGVTAEIEYDSEDGGITGWEPLSFRVRDTLVDGDGHMIRHSSGHGWCEGSAVIRPGSSLFDVLAAALARRSGEVMDKISEHNRDARAFARAWRNATDYQRERM